MKRMTAEKLYEGIGYMDDKWLALLDEPITEKGKMSRLIACELKKLFGVKYLWVFLFVMLMLNSAVAWYTADKTLAASEPVQMISGFFEEYFEAPEELNAYYKKMQDFNAEQQSLLREAMRNGNMDFEPETLPNLYSTDESYPDKMLFSKLYTAISAAEEYPEQLEKVIKRAKANLDAFSDMGIYEDSFTYKYQLKVIELYEKIQSSVELEVEYTRGWNEYFAYDTVNIFIFAMLIMLGSLIFVQEKQSGFIPIMRTAKNGRARTAVAKLITVMLLTVCFVLLFTLSTFAVYGLRLGFSSTENVIQALDSFTFSPYRITVGEYFLITLGVKLLTFVLFSMAVTALSAIFYNYILIYIIGLGLFGVNFLLYTLSYIDANSVFKNLNLVATSSVNSLFTRYRAMGVFGNVVGFVPAMLIGFSILTIVCAVAAVMIYVRGADSVRAVRIEPLDRLAAFCMTELARLKNRLSHISARKKSPARSYSNSLILAECFKTLISSKFIIIVLLILGVKVWYSYNVSQPSNSYSDSVYKEYMTRLEGELTDEKLDYIAAEREMIDATLSKEREMQTAYINNEISFDEYREYLSDYNYAYSRSRLLETIEQHAEYLIEKEAETGIKGWFIYDTGWSKMYSSPADLFLYTAILLLLTGSFASEYVSRSSSGGFAQLLRSTRNGRDKTFRAKLISSGMIAVILALLTGGADLAVIILGYDLPAANAPLMSIEMFSSVSSGITVIGYFAVFSIMRIAGALIMAMLVCALSELLARYIPILGTAVILTLLPALCAYFGLAAAEKVNFLNLLAGTPLFLQSANMSMLGNGYAMLILWLTTAAIAVTAMLLSAKRMFVK